MIESIYIAAMIHGVFQTLVLLVIPRGNRKSECFARIIDW